MKIIKILLISIMLFISISAVSAEGNFTALQEEIDSSTNEIEITQDYKYNNACDSHVEGIIINKSDFTINGNGHTIDGSNQTRIYDITGNNITISNLIIINGNMNGGLGGAIRSTGSVILNNVIFKDNHADYGGAIYTSGSCKINNITFANTTATKDGGAISSKELYCENVTFLDNAAGENGGSISSQTVELKNCEFRNVSADKGAAIFFMSNATVKDSIFLNSFNYTFSFIFGSSADTLVINNCSFLNSTSQYAPAIYSNTKTFIKNSIFKDLHAHLSGGAIVLKNFGNVELENCSFINTSATNNGGALFMDGGITFNPEDLAQVIIKNNHFINTSANFGGAIVQLESVLTILDSDFINNSVIYNGAAIYVSNTDFKLNNSRIVSNKLQNEELFNGGGIYCDYSNITIINSLFENNTKNAIYSYDCDLSVENTNFSANTEAIHGVFTNSANLKENNFRNDTIFLNDTDYIQVIKEKSIKFNLINNTINVTTLPSRFNSCEWGWVSSVKNQGLKGSCWTFGSCGALESMLIKKTGIEYNLSENNMLNSMIKYSKYGLIDSYEGGIMAQALEYLTSWLGVIPSKYDVYDEVGKLSPFITTDEKIHIQDAIIIEPRKNSTDNDAIKKTIIKCGSITTTFCYDTNTSYYNEKTHAYYQNNTPATSHAISIVGWDDNYSASNFIITPPGDGAFIIKNSFGENEGDNGYIYISYYDTSILNETIIYDYIESIGVGYLLENQDDYTKVYQKDTGGFLDRHNNYTTFKINYQSTGKDLISGIGCYFRENENYTIKLYVNNELKYMQNGSAPFGGYHTVKLIEEIPIKENDNFTVIMEKVFVPIIFDSRQHFEENSVFLEINGTWKDLALDDQTATLKVYTKDLTIYTEDLVKIYKNDSKFESQIDETNKNITFEINGKKYNRKTDDNGIARIDINLRPGDYTIKTTYNNISVENTITVLPTLIADNLVKYFRNTTQFYVSLIDRNGSSVVGTNITLNINGVYYNRVTNENGTGKLNINLAPDEYIITVTDPLTGLQMSYNVTVLPTLSAMDLEMRFNDNSTFNVTVFDGEGKLLANATISFNINGAFYTRYSDSNGIAKLNIDLMAGKYIITCEYDEMRISNTIIIKD